MCVYGNDEISIVFNLFLFFLKCRFEIPGSAPSLQLQQKLVRVFLLGRNRIGHLNNQRVTNSVLAGEHLVVLALSFACLLNYDIEPV